MADRAASTPRATSAQGLIRARLGLRPCRADRIVLTPDASVSPRGHGVWRLDMASNQSNQGNQSSRGGDMDRGMPDDRSRGAQKGGQTSSREQSRDDQGQFTGKGGGGQGNRSTSGTGGTSGGSQSHGSGGSGHGNQGGNAR